MQQKSQNHLLSQVDILLNECYKNLIRELYLAQIKNRFSILSTLLLLIIWLSIILIFLMQLIRSPQSSFIQKIIDRVVTQRHD